MSVVPPIPTPSPARGEGSKSASLITEHLDIWTSAVETRSTAGRGSSNKLNLYGIKKLRELILELAVRGQLVPQNPDDEPASVLLEKIAAEKARLIKDGKFKKQEPLPPITNDEKPFELPNGWEWTRLRDITQINPRNTADNELEVSFIPMPLILTAYDGRHEQEFKSWGEIKAGYTHFAEGDIAIAKITPCFENSKTAIFSNLRNGIGAGTTELHVARPFGENLSRNYVLLYLKSPMFLGVGESKMTGTAGQKRLPKDFFESNPLPFPPLAEQDRIVAKVNELMSLCDALEQEQVANIAAHQTLVEELLAALTQNEGNSWARIATHFDTLFTTEHSIDQLKQTILQLAVMGKLVPQDPNDEPASVLLQKIAAEKARLVQQKKIKDSVDLHSKAPKHSPFDIPNSWEWVRFRDVIWCYRGHNPPKSDFVYEPKEGYVRFVQITDFKTDNSAVYIPVSSKNKMIHKGEIIIAAYRHIGKLSRNMEGAFNVALCKIMEFTPMSRDFIELLIGTDVVKGELLRASERGHIPSMHSDHLLSLLIPVPPLAEQHRIVAKVDELMALCDAMKAQLKTAQTTQLQLADVLAGQAMG